MSPDAAEIEGLRALAKRLANENAKLKLDYLALLNRLNKLLAERGKTDA